MSLSARSGSSFGVLLRDHRLAAGLTQEALAERATVAPRSIQALERGTSRPHRDTAERLAGALQLAGPDRALFLATAAPAPRRRPVPGAAPRADPVPLVGRTREVALLEQHLATERPPLLLLAGEPGIGKSRLLAHAAHRAEALGWCVLPGGCHRRGSQEPYAPILGALQGHLRRHSSPQLRAQLQGCSWLIRLLPELAGGPIEPLPTQDLPLEQERRMMFEAVARFLSNVVGPAGTLLLLDDLQWAGPDALDLLAALLWTPWAVPVRVIGAYRDTELQLHNPLAEMLTDLAQAGRATQHTVGPLAPHDAAQLLAALLSDADGARAALQERIAQQAGGVPFFLVSYAHELRDSTLDGPAGLPWVLAQGLTQRVAALPEAGRDLLSAVAVLGQTATWPLLQALVARPEEEVLAGLEAACRARLLEEGPDAHRFPHDVIRDAVEGEMSAARRAALHRRAAEALEAHLDDHPVETLAYHCEQGAVWAKALTYLEQAGDRALTASAWRAAVDYYARAHAAGLRLGQPGLPGALAVARKRGLVHIDTGEARAAIAAFAEMGEAAQRLGDRRQQGMALAYRGMAAVMEHALEDAETALREALALGAEGFEDVTFAASVTLAEMLTCLARHTEAAPLLETAVALAPHVADESTRAVCARLVAFIQNWRGDFADAVATMERWKAAAEGNVGWYFQLVNSFGEGLVRGSKGEYRQALAALHSSLAIGARLGDHYAHGRCLNTLGWIYGELQDHERALGFNAQALQAVLGMQTPEPEAVNNARLNLGDNLLALGRLDEAEQQFQTVEQVVRQPRLAEQFMLWRYAQHLFHSYGALCLTRGEVERADSYAAECLVLAAASDSKKNIVKGRRLRGQALLAMGQLSEAEHEITCALGLARQIGNPPQLWQTLATLGALRHVQGRPADARRAYQDSLAVIAAVAADLDDPQLCETFLRSSQVNQIRLLAVGVERPR
ncbi:MAG: hypothetical protein NVSMB65_06220 [Chloroflexota bacterium]